MSNLSEIKHLDPDNRWHRMNLTRDREIAVFRTLLTVAAGVAVAGVAVVGAVKARRR